jgi:large subunit ribosomal protein L5
MAENPMRNIKIEKVVLNVGGVGEKLDKGVILLEKISGMKPIKVQATKRIPTWKVRPGLEVGTKVTIRDSKKAEDLIKRLLPAINNTLKEKQIKDNFVSFGVQEYIEIPDMEYIREVGIMGFEVTIVFSRPGRRIEQKKTKSGKIKRMVVGAEEIKEILKSKFGINILEKRKHNEEETQ